FRNGDSLRAQLREVRADRFLDQALDFVTCGRHRDAARKIWHAGAVAIGPVHDDDGVLHEDLPFQYKPACRRMLFNVPMGTSRPGCPDTVTSPGFVGWRK